MTDLMMRGLAKEAGILALVCHTGDLAAEATRRHATSPIATLLLGRSVTAGALMGGLLKNQQRMALRIGSNGPVQKLIAESDSYGHVRGYIAPATLDLAPSSPPPGSLGLFGNVGLLTVSKDLVRRGLSEGAVPLEAADLDANLEFYYRQSEQIPSLVRTGVALDENDAVDVAGGFLLQALPGHSPETWTEVTARVQELPPVETLVAQHDVDAVLAQLFADLPYEQLETRTPAFRCSCSTARARQGLQLLGTDELDALIDEGEAVIDCHFCHEEYIFDRAALEDVRRALLETRGA